jgi:hypothetical protein
MRPILSISALVPLVLMMTTSSSFANLCPDEASQKRVGEDLAMQTAKAALPEIEDLETMVSNTKEHQFSSTWDKYWYAGQPDYLTFDVLIGKPSSGAIGPLSPAVAYEVKVDTNCKAETMQLYTVE